MKYVLMSCADRDDVQRFATMTDAERAAQFREVGAWFAENQARIIGGRQLAAPQARSAPATQRGAGISRSSANCAAAGRRRSGPPARPAR